MLPIQLALVAAILERLVRIRLASVPLRLDVVRVLLSEFDHIQARLVLSRVAQNNSEQLQVLAVLLHDLLRLLVLVSHTSHIR